MPARAPSNLFRVAHARIDRLQVHLSARAQRELGSCLAAVSDDLDELLMLCEERGGSAAFPNRAIRVRIDRLSEHCAALEDALASEVMTVATKQAVAAIVEACADVATWTMEAKPEVSAEVA